MAIDPFDTAPPPRAQTHEIGQDLSTLSIEEIDNRIATLLEEIERLQEMRRSKQASREAADNVFKF